MILAAKRTREPITVLVPLIWLESRRSRGARVCNETIPESPLLYGVPMYAFDKHTRLGQSAIQRLIQESDHLRACLERLVPKQGWRKATQMAAFYTVRISFRAVLIGLYLDPSKPLASSPISIASVCPLRVLLH